MLVRLLLTFLFILLPFANIGFAQANYDTQALDALNDAKSQYGTPAEEAALQGALQSHTDGNNKINVSQGEKDANPLYQLVTENTGNIRTCNITRELKVHTEQRILEIKGNFLLRGNEYHSDLKECQIIRSYEPYQVEVDLPPEIITKTGSFDGPYRKNQTAAQRWNSYYRLYIPNSKPSYATKLQQVVTATAGTCLGELSYNHTYGMINTGADDFYRTYVSTTCIQPKIDFITKLKEVITNKCQALEANCTYLRTENGAGGCKTISGVEACPDWWYQNVTYSCEKQYECSLFPTSNDQCGTWFSSDLQGCQNSSQTGMKDIAMNKFRRVVGNFTCDTFQMNPIQGSIPTNSPYYNGCGLYDPLRTSNYQLIKREQSAIEGACISSLGNLPANILAQREDVDTKTGSQFKYATFDYWTEVETDSCVDFLEDMNKLSIPCTLIQEKTDGLITWSTGMTATVPESCKTMQGTVSNYEFCRSFWGISRTYECQIPTVDAVAVGSTEVLPLPALDPVPVNDSAGMDTALGTLAVIDEISKAITQDFTCPSPLPDGSCPADQIIIFAGYALSCIDSNVQLRVFNSTCCKANVVGCAGQQFGVLCDEYCEQQDIDLSLWHYVNHKTQIIGNYCAAWLFGIKGGTCLTERQNHCVFNSIIAKIIQVQGRAQLGRSFGPADNPNCAGLSMADFQAIDFTQVDFTEFINSLDLTPAQVGAIDPTAITDLIQKQIPGATNGP